MKFPVPPIYRHMFYRQGSADTSRGRTIRNNIAALVESGLFDPFRQAGGSLGTVLDSCRHPLVMTLQRIQSKMRESVHRCSVVVLELDESRVDQRLNRAVVTEQVWRDPTITEFPLGTQFFDGAFQRR